MVFTVRRGPLSFRQKWLASSAQNRKQNSLPLNGSEDEEMIRFDGSGVHPVTVDSDDDSDEEEGDISDDQEMMSDQIN